MRRLFLVLMVFAVPAVLTWALNAGTVYLLAATQRTIDPDVLKYAAIAEFAAFTFVTILETKSRWS